MSANMKIKVENGEVFIPQPDGDYQQVIAGQSFPLGMGTVEIKHTAKAGLHAVRLSGSGNFTYSVRLDRDAEYSLGASYGHRVRRSEEEPDPIRRVLRELQLPLSILEKMEVDVLSTDMRSYDHKHCPSRTASWCWQTDGMSLQSDTTCFSEPQNFFTGGYNTDIVITEATWAIKTEMGRHMNGCTYRHITRICVWPNCNPELLKNALKGIETY